MERGADADAGILEEWLLVRGAGSSTPTSFSTWFCPRQFSMLETATLCPALSTRSVQASSIISWTNAALTRDLFTDSLPVMGATREKRRDLASHRSESVWQRFRRRENCNNKREVVTNANKPRVPVVNRGRFFGRDTPTGFAGCFTIALLVATDIDAKR